MGPRARLDAMVKGKIPSLCWKLNPDHPAPSLVAKLTELSWHPVPWSSLIK